MWSDMLNFYKNMISKSRLESFSDGVMSIVITLLAFEIASPLNNSLNKYEGFISVYNLLPHFMLFFLSFITLALMWINHHKILSKIENLSTKVLWVNSILLMFIALVPFATTFLGKNPKNEFALVLYSFIMIIISLMFSQLARFMIKDPQEKEVKKISKKDILKKKFKIKLKHVGLYSYLLAFIFTLFSLPFSLFFGYLFIAFPLAFYIFSKR